MSKIYVTSGKLQQKIFWSYVVGYCYGSVIQNVRQKSAMGNGIFQHEKFYIYFNETCVTTNRHMSHAVKVGRVQSNALLHLSYV